MTRIASEDYVESALGGSGDMTRMATEPYVDAAVAGGGGSGLGGTLLDSDDFSTNTIADYTADAGGAWSISGGKLVEPATAATKLLVWTGGPSVTDCRVRAKAATNITNAGLIVARNASGRMITWQTGGFYKWEIGSPSTLAGSGPTWTTGQFIEVQKVGRELIGRVIDTDGVTLLLSGSLALSPTEASDYGGSGKVGITAYDGSQQFDDLEVFDLS